MIYYFDSLESTNQTLKEIAKNDAKNFCLVWTQNQTNGKGYYGNHWHADKGKNLTFSFLILSNLNKSEQVYFNMWVANSLRLALSDLMPFLCIKWPNDLIVKKQKIAGVLIEAMQSTHATQWIIGIGLNVNQTEFNNLPKATSMSKITKKVYDLEKLLTDILAVFKQQYALVENKSWQDILKTYNQHLFLRNKVACFKQNNQAFNGLIKEVNPAGNLVVEIENGAIKEFKHKEIELLY